MPDLGLKYWLNVILLYEILSFSMYISFAYINMQYAILLISDENIQSYLMSLTIPKVSVLSLNYSQFELPTIMMTV